MDTKDTISITGIVISLLWNFANSVYAAKTSKKNRRIDLLQGRYTTLYYRPTYEALMESQNFIEALDTASLHADITKLKSAVKKSYGVYQKAEQKLETQLARVDLQFKGRGLNLLQIAQSAHETIGRHVEVIDGKKAISVKRTNDTIAAIKNEMHGLKTKVLSKMNDIADDISKGKKIVL